MVWKKLFSFVNRRETEANKVNHWISEEALAIINKHTNGRVQPFYKTDLYTEKRAEIVGVWVESKPEEAEPVALILREKLAPLNYLVFICDFECKKIAMIHGSDQFDILKVQQTNGDNYDISNEMVISKLKKWNERYPFTIQGADYDWLEANFQVLPEDRELKTLAKEIYKFCPDIVEQGSGSIDELIKEMKDTRKLYLWWD